MGETKGFRGLAGHQPRGKTASSGFSRRASLKKIRPRKTLMFKFHHCPGNLQFNLKISSECFLSDRNSLQNEIKNKHLGQMK